MPFDIGGFAEQTAGGIVGAGMGLLLENHNDRRQIEQQQKLTNIQLAANKQITGYNYDRQLEMWKNTSYGAQKEQMIKAGLNPGLLYGISGGGGTTTGSGGGSISGGQAPSGGHEIMDLQGQMMAREQLQLLQAQKENIQADTKNKESQIPVNQATVPNIQADTAFKNVNTAIANIERQIKDETKEDQSAAITAIARQAEEELQTKIANKTITEAEAINATNSANERLLTLQLQNENLRKDLKLKDEQITQIINKIMQDWKSLDIQEFNSKVNAEYQGLEKIVGKWMQKLITKMPGGQ